MAVRTAWVSLTSDVVTLASMNRQLVRRPVLVLCLEFGCGADQEAILKSNYATVVKAAEKGKVA